MNVIYKSSKRYFRIIIVTHTLYLIMCAATIYCLFSWSQGVKNSILIFLAISFGYLQLYWSTNKYLKNYEEVVICEETIFINNIFIDWKNVVDIDQTKNANYFYIKFTFDGKEKEVWCFNRFMSKELVVLNHRTQLVRILRMKLGKSDLD